MGLRQSLVADSSKLAPASAVWQVPEPGGTAAPPTASRDFAAGELVERVYCLALGEKDLLAGQLAQYVVEVKQPGLRLFPLNWGLLYGLSSTDCNLNAEYRHEPPAPAPEAEAAPAARPTHWLLIRARRAIKKGEPLCLPSGLPSAPTVFTQACAQFEEHFEWGDEFESLAQQSPDSMGLAATGDIVMAASAVHNVGVFASRAFKRGELVELSPVLPVLASSISGSVLEDYHFHACAEMDPEVSFLVLGNGMVFNHSPDGNVCHYLFDDGNPFAFAWIADRDIEAGEELCHDYSDEFWEGRNMEVKGADGDVLPNKGMSKSKTCF